MQAVRHISEGVSGRTLELAKVVRGVGQDRVFVVLEIGESIPSKSRTDVQ